MNDALTRSMPGCRVAARVNGITQQRRATKESVDCRNCAQHFKDCARPADYKRSSSIKSETPRPGICAKSHRLEIGRNVEDQLNSPLITGRTGKTERVDFRVIGLKLELKIGRTPFVAIDFQKNFQSDPLAPQCIEATDVEIGTVAAGGTGIRRVVRRSGVDAVCRNQR
ncbi:MAG: hypothetical protein ABJA83_00250 [Burkholderiaceae bacterium]